jgi:STE24 endopeptidase
LAAGGPIWLALPAWQADRVTDGVAAEGGFRGPSTRLCLAIVALSLLILVVLGVLLVPWSWVPGGHPATVRAAEVFSAAQIERAQSYASVQRHLGWASLALTTLLALALGLTRGGAWLARRCPGPWWVRALLVTFVLLLLADVVTLPLGLAIRHRDLRFGLTQQSLGGWWQDQATSLLVSWVFVAVMVVLVLGTARCSPTRWPLWTAAAGAVLTVFGSWVYPVVVEPLFNSFTSLPDGALRTDVFHLAAVEHVPIRDVLVADASRRTTTLNAYVSGFGDTRRVVLYDNLVRDEPRRVTLSVVAHELGHARHHDVAIGTALGAACAALGSGLLGLLLSRRRLLDRAGADDAGAPEVVALLLALAAVGSLLASPVQNTVSRAIEARADRSALEATHDYTSFDEVQKQLALRSLSDPTPPTLSQFWFGSHPTTLQRIGIAQALQREDRAR